MIEVHVTNALLAPGFRAGAAFRSLDFLNGLVAPSFLFCAGVAAGIKMHPLARDVRRSLVLLAFGYLLHLSGALRGDWAGVFQVDGAAGHCACAHGRSFGAACASRRRPPRGDRDRSRCSHAGDARTGYARLVGVREAVRKRRGDDIVSAISMGRVRVRGSRMRSLASQVARDRRRSVSRDRPHSRRRSAALRRRRDLHRSAIARRRTPTRQARRSALALRPPIATRVPCTHRDRLRHPPTKPTLTDRCNPLPNGVRHTLASRNRLNGTPS